MLETILIGTSLVVTAIAAVTDHRTGQIPNWLTLPVLLVAPVFHGLAFGFHAACLSALGAVLVGVIPFFAWRSGGLGGGDVKLFMALGALLGAGLGFRVEMVAFLAGAIFSLIVVARRRQLGQAMRALGRSLMRPFSAPVASEPTADLGMIRFGPVIFLATIFTTLSGLV